MAKAALANVDQVESAMLVKKLRNIRSGAVTQPTEYLARLNSCTQLNPVPDSLLNPSVP
jgi:hypothetical protein